MHTPSLPTHTENETVVRVERCASAGKRSRDRKSGKLRLEGGAKRAASTPNANSWRTRVHSHQGDLMATNGFFFFSV